MHRRTFLKAAAGASALTILPSNIMGGLKQSPNDKLNIGMIGVAGMAAWTIQQFETENVVALCDVDWKHAADTFAAFPKAKRYKDFRRMLDSEKTLDAVIVSTPDHFHAVATMAAINRGLHVYCEKPLTHTIHEARTVARAAREAGVATQMGIQGHAMESARTLCEWIWDGAIGDVTEVHAWTPHAVWPQGMQKRPNEQPDIPETLEWDLWLGPAAYRPYHPAYLPGLWRGWKDFGTGGLGDMGCHIFDHIVWSLELGASLSVEASCSHYVEELTWDIKPNLESYPRASFVTYKFPARGKKPPVTLHWYDGGLMPPRPEELEPGRKMGDQYGGTLYVGSKGKILTGSHGARACQIIPREKMIAYEKPQAYLERSVGHHQEWINACKGGASAKCNFDYAGALTETVLLGNIALEMQQKLYWDAEMSTFTNAPEADALLHREYRKGWSLNM
jgi:predicted dehydrogenase